MDIVFKKFVNRCKMSEKIIGGQIYESKNKFWQSCNEMFKCLGIIVGYANC